MHEVDIKEFEAQAFELFRSDWAALAAGTEDTGANAMTIAWGALGNIWEKDKHRPEVKGPKRPMPTCTVYVRPTRYTKEFMDREPYFTVNVLPKDKKRALGYLGGHSGRDVGDKFAAAGITPVYEDGTVRVAEARLVLVCRKIYAAPLVDEGFVDRELIPSNYPKLDFHTMYIGEVLKVLEAE